MGKAIVIFCLGVLAALAAESIINFISDHTDVTFNSDIIQITWK